MSEGLLVVVQVLFSPEVFFAFVAFEHSTVRWYAPVPWHYILAAELRFAEANIDA